MAARRLLEDGHDLALTGLVTAPPRADRLAAEPLREHLEHRLHLPRQPGQDVDVAEDEAGRAAERILERDRAARQPRPARRVLSEAATGEAVAQLRRELRHVLARGVEGRRDRFARQIVRRPAKPARDDDDRGALHLHTQELRDLLDGVADGGNRSTSSPSSPSRRASQEALVFSTSPQTISFPTVRTTAVAGTPVMAASIGSRSRARTSGTPSSQSTTLTPPSA